MKQVQLRPAELEFDFDNPRLFGHVDEHSSEACAEALLDEHDPVNIGRAMSAFGYFLSEPMIVLQEPEATPPYPVLEGNRRLLAIRLLLDSELRESLGAMSEWDELAKQASEAGTVTPDTQIQALSVESRQVSLPAIGFRHIVGIKKWGALEKAAFVNQLVNPESEADRGFEKVAGIISESTTAVRRAVRDYRLLLEMERLLDTRLEKARDDFGAFSRFLQAGGTREFLGLQELSAVPLEASSPLEGDDDRVRALVSLLYGDDNSPAVVGDSRRATELGKALASEEARDYLLEHRDLEQALLYTDAVEKRIYRQIQTALTTLRNALRDVELLPVERVDGIQEEVSELAEVVARVEQALVEHGTAEEDLESDSDD